MSESLIPQAELETVQRAVLPVCRWLSTLPERYREPFAPRHTPMPGPAQTHTPTPMPTLTPTPTQTHPPALAPDDWSVLEALAPPDALALRSAPLQRCVRALLTVAALYHHTQGRAGLAEQLWQKAASFQKVTDDWILTGTALELLPPELWKPARTRASSVASPLDRPVQVFLEPPDLRPDHPKALAFMAERAFASVGPDLEPKLRVSTVELRQQASTGSSSYLQLGLVPTTWTRGRGFHRALEVRQQPGNCSEDELLTVLSLLPHQLSSHPSVPDIAALHLIVRTSDGQVPLLQRSENVSYAPLHWSASLEEQWTQADFPGDALSQAARRAVLEELGLSLPPGHPGIHLLSLYMELQFLSLGAVVLVDAPFDRATLEAQFAQRASSPHGWESSGLRWIDARPETLERVAGEAAVWPLHPTASLRLRLLARWLRAVDTCTDPV